jgi:hypothetical protein
MTRIHSCTAFAMAAVGLLLGSGTAMANPQDQSPSPTVSADRTDTLADIPSGNAIVTFANGMLTVKARSARLSDVLRTACGLIGADFGAPAAGADEPISRILGPAPAAEVLRDLLRNTGLNYAMSRSANDSNLPMSLTILSRAQGPPASLTAKEPRKATTAAPEDSKPAAELTAANTQVVEGNSADPEIADPPDKPSKAQLALLEKLRPMAAGDAEAGADPDTTTVPVQRDTGARRGHRVKDAAELFRK